jgi:hypothetical protein
LLADFTKICSSLSISTAGQILESVTFLSVFRIASLFPSISKGKELLIKLTKSKYNDDRGESCVMSENEMFRFMCEMLGPQLVALFWEVLEILGGGGV